MPGSITQPPCSTPSFDLPDGDDDPTHLAPVDGGDIEVKGDADDDAVTVVTSTNS
jgi:hypothetical protein